jgi:2-oxoglutarate ferredoxin oxidoreductase subunit gamma
MITKIILAGEGGQGVQTVAEILAKAGLLEKKEICYIPNFGVEQRGGVSIAFVQIGDEPISFPKFSKGDIVIALSERAVERTQMYVDKHTLFVYDSSHESAPPQMEAKAIKGVPALTVANKELSSRVFNVIILGAVLAASKVVSRESAREALLDKLGAKVTSNPALMELNNKALDRGMQLLEN